MKTKAILTRAIAIVGTVLVWLPILAPVLFSAALFARAHVFRFDYLMPAELFPVILIGGALLVWAALRARSRHGLIGWGLGVAAVLLTGGQALAVATGLASGATEPTGLWFTLVIATIVGFNLAVIAIGVGGILLLRDLRPRPDL
ncbi:MAG: hypothetical protein MUF84_21060 [Anaerolineae bacterium]|nr:hypothetical protein [Anaerolineae bacterium]